jgi:hypothetical protein
MVLNSPFHYPLIVRCYGFVAIRGIFVHIQKHMDTTSPIGASVSSELQPCFLEPSGLRTDSAVLIKCLYINV